MEILLKVVFFMTALYILMSCFKIASFTEIKFSIKRYDKITIIFYLVTWAVVLYNMNLEFLFR